jgi:hypothetical protein
MGIVFFAVLLGLGVAYAWGRSQTRELYTAIEIDAPAGRVWTILTDLDAFTEWNPHVRQAEGEVREGAKLRIRVEAEDGKGMTFKPTVIRVDPQREFRWLGSLLLPGIFDGEHIFEIIPSGDGRVRFVQREQFTGVLVPLMWKSLDTTTRQGFEDMNVALKKRSETGQP